MDKQQKKPNPFEKFGFIPVEPEVETKKPKKRGRPPKRKAVSYDKKQKVKDTPDAGTIPNPIPLV